MTQRIAYWGAIALLLAGLTTAELIADRPPAPKPETAPTTVFAEGRARALIHELSEVIGPRLAGTENGARAAELIATRLRQLPRVEVEVQDIEGESMLFGSLSLYSTRNVIARLPGQSPEAVLLSAHYDTPLGSVGAADDAAGVATLVECLRVLAAGPVLPRTIIVEINGAEERGLLGAVGFLKHKWAREVHSFVNLEAAGAAGRAILFRVSPGNAWLAEAYARAAPHPFGNVIGQDLFQLRLVPSDTDYTVFSEAHVPGLDVALFEDGWAYHTSLDRLARLEPGSVQHMGDNTLAVARALAETTPALAGNRAPVYYDVLGRWMLHYGVGRANALAAIVTVLALLLLAIAVRRGKLRVGALLGAGATAFGALLVGLALPVAAALAVAASGHRMGWFSVPALAVLAYAPFAIAGVLAVLALRLRRREVADPIESLAGVLILHLVLLGLLTVAGMGTAYLFLWWSAGTALALACALFGQGRLLRLAPLVPALYFSVQLLTLLLVLFVPISERMLALPVEPMIAVIVALPVALGTLGLVTDVARVGNVARAFAILGIVGAIVSAMHFPYTPERPHRAAIEQQHRGEKAEMVIHGAEVLRRNGINPVPEHVEPDTQLAPRIEVLSSELIGADRRVHLRVSGGDGWRLSLPAGSVHGWSLASAVPTGPIVVRSIGMPGKASELTLTLGPAPVPVVLRGSSAVTTPAIDAVRARLPAWTVASSIVLRDLETSL